MHRTVCCVFGAVCAAVVSLAPTRLDAETPPRATCAAELESAIDLLGIDTAQTDVGPQTLELASAVEVAARIRRPTVPRTRRVAKPALNSAQPTVNDDSNLEATEDSQEADVQDEASGEEGATAEVSDSESSEADPESDQEPVKKADTLPIPELTSELEALRDNVRRTLGMYYPRHLNARDHTPWEVMHGFIAYGVGTQLYTRGPGGNKVNAIAWMCWDRPCRGLHMLYLDRGRINAKKGVDLQGHHGQFLAILAQSHVKSSYPMRAGNKQFTIADLIQTEMETCYSGTELTFKLISLAHYLDTDTTWKNERGEDWSIPRLIAEESRKPISRLEPCGGTHRLMGLSYAVYKRNKEGMPIDGEFERANRFTRDYQRRMLDKLQNRDGSFSTMWFERSEARADADRRLQTSGHMLEWLVFSLPDEELTSPGVIHGVNYIAMLLGRNPRRNWEIGPLGHGLHALAIYDRRLFQPFDEPPPVEVAQREAPVKDQVQEQDTAADAEPSAADDTADDEATEKNEVTITGESEESSEGDESTEASSADGSDEAEIEGPYFWAP